MDRDNLQRGARLGIIATIVYLAFSGPGETSRVAGLLGEGSAELVGFILLAIGGAVYGAIYAGWVERLASGGWQTLLVGLVYGIVWWIISPNIVEPALSGGDVLALDLSGAAFFGHLISGVTMAWIAEATGGGEQA